MQRRFPMWLVIAVLSATVSAVAQDAGPLRITVSDANGAGLPGATVRVVCGATTRSSTTDATGFALVSDVPAGACAVSVDATGFEVAHRANVTARAIDVTLRPAPIDEQLGLFVGCGSAPATLGGPVLRDRAWFIGSCAGVETATWDELAIVSDGGTFEDTLNGSVVRVRSVDNTASAQASLRWNGDERLGRAGLVGGGAVRLGTSSTAAFDVAVGALYATDGLGFSGAGGAGSDFGDARAAGFTSGASVSLGAGRYGVSVGWRNLRTAYDGLTRTRGVTVVGGRVSAEDISMKATGQTWRATTGWGNGRVTFYAGGVRDSRTFTLTQRRTLDFSQTAAGVGQRFEGRTTLEAENWRGVGGARLILGRRYAVEADYARGADSWAAGVSGLVRLW